jgi:hypothetical protein
MEGKRIYGKKMLDTEFPVQQRVRLARQLEWNSQAQLNILETG